MKISTREIVMLTVLFLMMLGGAYYMFFYTPDSEEISRLQESINSKNTQIDNASITLLRRQALALQKDALEEEFAGIAEHLHEDFHDADVLRQLERIIMPYTHTMNIAFANRTAGTKEATGITSVRTVQVSLYTTYSNLLRILRAFEEDDIANRIINFTCGIYNDELAGAGNQEMSVSISIDYLVV